ncbi:hypothetical protein EWM64_g2990 [Hericium alpestre]|uniref:Uncharacterized protein n=1 Tax=Hericium alpestre TaxID=135208 RepID=A0A4Z0A1R6_9AGAM|nr:hypothetical protein EWM64_g2990 [Hericium alpestre]
MDPTCPSHSLKLNALGTKRSPGNPNAPALASSLMTPLASRISSLAFAVATQLHLSHALPASPVFHRREVSANAPTHASKLLAIQSAYIVPPGTVVKAAPLSADRHLSVAEQDRRNVIVASILALSLVVICVLIVRYLQRQPFQIRPRRKAAEAATDAKKERIPDGAGFGFDGLDRGQWLAVRDREYSIAGSSTPGSALPDKPPAVLLKQELPLSPISPLTPLDEKWPQSDAKGKT